MIPLLTWNIVEGAVLMTFSMKGKIACWIVPDQRLLELRLMGFWTMEVAETIDVEIRRHIDEVGGGGKIGFKMLIDAAQFQVQSDAVRETIVKKSIVYSINHGLEMSARIVSRAITQLQFKSLKREVDIISDNKNVQFGEFYTRREAMAWLGLPFFMQEDPPQGDEPAG
jgi:hypothetical protein